MANPVEARIFDVIYPLAGGTLVASSADSEFPVANLTHPFRSKVWRTTGKTDENVVINLGAATQIDSVALLFDSLGGNKFTGGATITIQANASDAWGAPSVSQVLTIDTVNKCATHFFSSPQNFQYWRLRLQDAGNSLTYLEVGKLLLSKATQLTQTPDIGFKYRVSDQSKLQTTAYGHQYADIYPVKKGFEFNYDAMTQADFVTLLEIYRLKGNTQVIAFALDPTEQLFDKDRYFIYGYFGGDFTGTHKFLGYFNNPIKIEEAI